MNAFFERHRNRLLVVLAALAALSLALASCPAWADPGTERKHELTYTLNRLRWESPTKVDPLTGVAQLTLFDAVYGDTVASQDGEKVIAPGTAGANRVRLSNKVHGPVEFIAVLYQIQDNVVFPVTPVMQVDSAKPVKELTQYNDLVLPQGIDATQVVSAWEGVVPAQDICDFVIHWRWLFEQGAAQDEADTLLGNQAELDEISVGLYIIVEDNNIYYIPTVPKTGDDSVYAPYLAILLCSVAVISLLGAQLWRAKKQKKADATEGGKCAG